MFSRLLAASRLPANKSIVSGSLAAAAAATTHRIPQGARQFASESGLSQAELNSLQPNSRRCVETEYAYAAHNYHPLPIVVSRAQGVNVWDADGKQYMDFLSCYSVVNQGHLHPKIVKAMKDQLDRVSITSRAVYSDQLPEFAKYITEYFGYDKVLPMNTGAEGVETAIKIARRYAYDRRGVPDNEAVIISACGCFHGRTLQAISMSCDAEARRGFGPLVPGHVKVRYNDLEHLEAKLKQYQGRVAAFIVEPIQGEGGVVVPQDGYMKRAQELCHKYGALLIADEIQTGCGRTGKLLACDYDGVKPDILILAKALSGGLYPVCCVLTSNDIMDVITPGSHGSTFGGNPLGCAVARAALEVIKEENLVERSFRLGERFRNGLLPLVNEPNSPISIVRGKGLLNAIVMKTDDDIDKSAMDLCLLLRDRGIIAKPTHNTIIRLAPPLIITEDEVDRAVEIISKSVRELRSIPRSKIPGADPVFKPTKSTPCNHD